MTADKEEQLLFLIDRVLLVNAENSVGRLPQIYLDFRDDLTKWPEMIQQRQNLLRILQQAIGFLQKLLDDFLILILLSFTHLVYENS